MSGKGFYILECPACITETSPLQCPQCHGMRVIAWDGQRVYYWGRIITSWFLAQQLTKKIIRRVIIAMGYLYGIFGIGSLVYALYQLHLLGETVLALPGHLSIATLVFWSSLLVDGYLYYMFQRDMAEFKRITLPPYALSRNERDQQLDPVTWHDIARMNRQQFVDISTVFSQQGLLLIDRGWHLAARYGQHPVQPIHLLIASLTFEQVGMVVHRLAIPIDKLKAAIAHALQKYSSKKGIQPVFNDALYHLLFDAYRIAAQNRRNMVDVIEIFEALIVAKGDAQDIFYELGVEPETLQNVIAWVNVKKLLRERWSRFRKKAAFRSRGTMNKAMTAIATPMLDALSQDLTILAQYGYLMPCIGREKEMDDAFRIMESGARRNVMFVGFPGVGRTTIAEGIAQRIVEDNVPTFLHDKRLVSLSVAKLVSGVSPSEAQQRLLIALNEIRRSGNIVLFISDIHVMTGITAGGQGSIDLAGVLAQTLNRSGLLCIATTTPQDYRRYIESTSALTDVFERVNVDEATGNEAIQIIQAKSGATEYQQGVYFSYAAIERIVAYAQRYIHDRYLPDKAIELMQQVAGFTKNTKGKGATVTAGDVATVVSQKTGIPLTDITTDESKKLLALEETMHTFVIGQEEAVSMVATSIRRARAELRDQSRPIVNLLFLGPTGVGKTELAKTVARVYFGAEDTMIRLDMSEYQDKTSLNRLIGAPPGFEGSDQGGYLTEAIRKNPFSLVLLDELEKAHPDILNVFLQVMDDGRLTDTQGRTVDFTNAIIIATSNAGTSVIQDLHKKGMSAEEIRGVLAEQELQKYFRPEFLNRFDGVIVFKPLTLDQVKQIAKLLLREVEQAMEDKGVALQVTDAAIDELAHEGFDPLYGARPLRRVIQKRVQDPLANFILTNSVARRDAIVVDAGGKVSVIKAERYT